MTPTPTIEQLWNDLRTSHGGSRQRRIDASHPLDLYADFEAPDRPGLVAVCKTRASDSRSLRALSIEQGARSDGRWSLRIVLNEPQLLPVFAALCRDIISYTRNGIDQTTLADAVIRRIDRWRSLLERNATGLGESVLRGLIGELFVLEHELLRTLVPSVAVKAWLGPQGFPQDFLLPSGIRIEVKTIGRDASTVLVSGLGQLDAGVDPLAVMVVRAEVTGASAPDAATVPLLVSRLRSRLAQEPDALVDFDAALACVGWHEHPSHDSFALRPLSLELYDVDDQFPRLTAASVPSGVESADYTVRLPRNGRTVWRGDQ
jgi:putative PD-(D/E)XK family protein DUF4420